MSELQKTTDIIIGEAAKKLLEADEEISFDSLLRVISETYHSLQDDSLKSVFLRAITHIRGYGCPAEKKDEEPEQSLIIKLRDISDNTH